MIQTITQLRKTCIAGCAIALCSLGLQAQNAELVKLSVPQPVLQELRADDTPVIGDQSIPASEKQALIDIYNSLDGANWTPSWNRWDLTADPTTWKGVTIKDGHVVELKIDLHNAKGELSASIANLTELEVFWCQSNEITKLPDELFTMPKLRELAASLQNIGGNRTLTQEFPKKVDMPALETLFMDSNALTGSLPSDINLPKIKTLCLQDNKLTGSIPKALTKCANLEYLYLHKNALSGEVPQDWSACKKLKQLVIEQNPQLEGTFPASWTQLTELQTISIQDTSIKGEIPSDIGNLVNLQDLLFTRSKMGGLIPENIGQLTQMTQLAFGECQFKAPLPESLTNLKKLTLMQFTGNPLGGEIPAWLSSFPKLNDLRMAKCQLTGEIPASLFPTSKDSEEGLCKLKNLDFSYNELTGQLPETITNCSNLVRLWVCHNKMSGNPTGYFTYENFPHLVQIELNDNNFSGGVGTLFTNPERVLSRVDISNNNFSGPILPEPSTSGYGVLLGFYGENAIVHSNKFVFADFSNFQGSLEIGADGDRTLVYTPQKPTTEDETLELAEGKSVTLNATLDEPANWKQDGDSFVHNKYQWYKDGKAIAGETKPTYTIASYSASDNGVYNCEITNIIAPKLKLTTGKTTLKQIVSVSEVAKPALHITRDAATLHINDAQSVALYTMEGACIARTEGSTLSIEGVAPGCYLIVVTVDNVRHTVKYVL
ncbi:MAG: immunoglobulin domain-containing protein [Porphyromonas sp.]|uniref:leucine-rich repeat domain-containing protein n=1 Tax=Porphyromonas sp. TaxID=1924944 RepID=UPI002A7F340A|nr:immunoglobulin domain-containing protein [Porphyromonas sp.]MDY4246241.1 immunoglobulin domain-containing protein [Porphyromonas sp.]